VKNLGDGEAVQQLLRSQKNGRECLRRSSLTKKKKSTPTTRWKRVNEREMSFRSIHFTTVAKETSTDGKLLLAQAAQNLGRTVRRGKLLKRGEQRKGIETLPLETWGLRRKIRENSLKDLLMKGGVMDQGHWGGGWEGEGQGGGGLRGFLMPEGYPPINSPGAWGGLGKAENDEQETGHASAPVMINKGEGTSKCRRKKREKAYGSK